jgi:hypothetical protein
VCNRSWNPVRSTASVHTISSVSRPATRCQQIEVGAVQPGGVADPIGHGHEHVANRIDRRFGHQAIAQPVLVDAIGFRDAALVLAKRAGQNAVCARMRAAPRSTSSLPSA